MADNMPRVYLIDASIYIFRAWFSVPATLTDTEGKPINALHGFASFIAGFLDEVQPGYLGVVFDTSLTTSFRNEINPDYKANRELPPPELKRQMHCCRSLVRSLGLADFASQRYEADDLIGSLAVCLRPLGFSIVVVSADKDLAQVIDRGDILWDYARNRKYSCDAIAQWLGVEPHQVADFLALTGDAVDNIVGIPGIGPKTAAALLAKFGSLENIYRQIDAVAAMKLRGAKRIQALLAKHREQVMLARLLTGVAIDPHMQIGEDDVIRREVTSQAVRAESAALGLGPGTQARLARAAGVSR